MTSVNLTLAERVYNVLAAEHGIGINGPVSSAHTYPATPQDGRLTQFEFDCLDWGLVYGIAYGIARAEDAFESEESVTGRVLEAARVAHLRWAGGEIFTGEAFGADRRERPDADRAEAVA